MKPRYYQQAAHDAVWRYLRETQGNPVVVLPTGAGKSLLAAMLVQQAIDYDARVIVVQHRKELITQNAEKIRLLLPGVDLGINSAGLRRHARDNNVLCCGIQTVYKKAHDLGRRELVIVDEAHLIGTDSESMYGKFIHDLKQVNPKLRVVGLTATPYRTGEGPICRPDRLFQRICYEVFTGDLIAEGFLSPLTNKAAAASVDTSGIKMRGGEFVPGEAEKAFDAGENVVNACREIVAKCVDRHSILVFCAGVIHAGHVAEVLAGMTCEEVGVVTGETFPMERERILSDFRAGRLRWCVNVDVLTTGFDSPRIDAIAVLRATLSPGLFAQIVGRGLRRHEDKQDCIAEGQRVLTDHGLVEIQNIKKHMKIWDGVEFVPHCGIVLRGELPVISYAGLTATEDHNVWTKEGWMPFGVAKLQKIEISVTGDDDATVWESENRFRNNSPEGQGQGLRLGCLFGMRNTKPEGLRFCASVKSWMQKVWEKTKLRQAVSWCSEMAFDALHCSKSKMHKPQRQPIQRLWRTWNNIRVRFSEPNGEVLTGQLRDEAKPSDRQNRQQQRIHCRKSSGCFRKDEHEQSSQQPHSKKQVWDIVNCGPRRRFTCEGLLVSNCYVLDFGENIKRHGSLDDPNYGRLTAGSGSSREAPTDNNGRGKPCPNCGLDVAPRSVECPECGWIFPPNHGSTADEDSGITGAAPPEVWDVTAVAWSRHQRKDDPTAYPTVRVDYMCQPHGETPGNLSGKKISEWVCFDHDGFARTKACLWWTCRSDVEVPDSVADALVMLDRGACRQPTTITTEKDGKWYRIKQAEFDAEKPTDDDLLNESEEEFEPREFSGVGEDVPF